MSETRRAAQHRAHAVWVVLAAVVLLVGGLLVWGFLRPPGTSVGSGSGSGSGSIVGGGAAAPSSAENEAGSTSAAPASDTATNADPPVVADTTDVGGAGTGGLGSSEERGPATGVIDAPIPPELAPVPASQTVQADDGTGGSVAISLAKVEAVQGEASVAGETSGPALRVTLHLENDSDAPVNLDYVAVNLYSGADRAPAPSIMHPGGSPLSGTLQRGASTDGVYVFTISDTDRSDVLIGVDYVAGQPTVTFEGSFA